MCLHCATGAEYDEKNRESSCPRGTYDFMGEIDIIN